MSNLTSAASGEASVSSSNNKGEPSNSIYHQQQHYFSQQNQAQDHDDDPPQQPPSKKKRNLPGNPDPEAEVIALSPKSLLATNRFVCEICNKGFQRDQNLQLHRRGHNLPWKLRQRTNKEVIRKKVYVCPEASCVHHDPSRALGDLTGIKKHFCRKHGEKKWKCDKCSKRYAVQSDWKAHSKVCGTREYRCDCGTLFSRRDSFITHRAFCDVLAEETARAITTNSLLSNPITSTPHFIHQQQEAQFQEHDPLQAFPLKREQHQHPTLMSLPPWLNSPTSSSSIFHQDNQPPQQSQNPSMTTMNPSMGPTSTSLSFTGIGVGGGGGDYHTQASPHMSATALLQRATQMGATISKNAGPLTTQHHHHCHVPDTTSFPPTTTTTTTAGLFGLNLSSREHRHEITTTRSGPAQILGSNPGPSSSIILHDMMLQTLSSSSSYDNHGGNEGMTRDFLGLRPLSHNDILTFAGFGNCMASNTSSHDHRQHNDKTHKPWQG